MEPKTQYNLLLIWQGYLPISHNRAFEVCSSLKNLTVENTLVTKMVSLL